MKAPLHRTGYRMAKPVSRKPKMVTLRNGAVVEQEVLQGVMLIIVDFLCQKKRLQGLFSELLHVCRDADYVPKRSKELKAYGLMEPNGTILQEVRDIVLAVLHDSSGEIVVRSPFAQ